MAPKKAKKGKKQAFDNEDLDEANIQGLGEDPEPTAAAAKPNVSAPKKKKGKKSLKAGDWSDDDDANTKEVELDNAEEGDEALAVPQAPAAASTFALLEVRRCL